MHRSSGTPPLAPGILRRRASWAAPDLPADVPSNWQAYFNVEDADASVEKAVALGARVVDGPEDPPFGRLATLADPTGAMFKIIPQVNFSKKYRPAASHKATGRYSFVMADTWGDRSNINPASRRRYTGNQDCVHSVLLGCAGHHLTWSGFRPLSVGTTRTTLHRVPYPGHPNESKSGCTSNLGN